MEIGIFLNLVDDLNKEEETAKINNDLSSLKTHLTQSKANNPQANQNIEKTINSLRKKCKESIVNELTRSNEKVLIEIKANEYFGEELLSKIELVFDTHKYSIDTQIVEIEKLRKKRDEFIDNLKNSQENLKFFGLEEYYNTDDLYEVGIIIPKADLQSAPQLEKIIHNWNFIVKSISELTNNDFSDIVIHRTNNGCIELFFVEAYEVVKVIGGVITSLVGIYESIKKIRSYVKGLKAEGIEAKTTKLIENEEKGKLEEKIDEIVDKIFKEHKVKDQGRNNELKIAIRKSIVYIAKSIDKGIEIELIPPYADSLEEIKEEESDAKKKEIEKKNREIKTKNERIETVKSFGKGLKEISNIGEEIFKLLKGGDEKLD